MINIIDVTSLTTIIGVLAFWVSVITQVTKEISFLNKIPTSLQVIVLSIALSIITYFSYASVCTVKIEWYMIVASIIAGFFVAFVAMFGWEKLSNIYDKLKNKNN